MSLLKSRLLVSQVTGMSFKSRDHEIVIRDRISRVRRIGVDKGSRFKSSDCSLSRRTTTGGRMRWHSGVCQKTNWSTRRQSGAIQIDIDTKSYFQQRGWRREPRLHHRVKCPRYPCVDKRSIREIKIHADVSCTNSLERENR